MWWKNPVYRQFHSLIPENILEIVARAYALVEVGGISGYGPERGRNLERVFYHICERYGVHLSERAGSKSFAEQRSASGFRHEIDGATRSVDFLTQWELKHVTTKLHKNELLIYNGKGLDFLYGSDRFFAQIPVLRFLLSGSSVSDECRSFSVLWGIMIIEPGRLPIPLLYEAIARGASQTMSKTLCDNVRAQLTWACRPLQQVIQELSAWASGNEEISPHGPSSRRAVKSVIDIQQQIGVQVMDYLDNEYPDWVDELANETWLQIDGW